MSKQVNALRAFAGGAIAIGGLIRNARLDEAREDARDDRKAVEEATDAFNDFLASGSTDAMKGLKLQQAIGDAQANLNDSQRIVDSIQSEEALWSAAGGTAMALDGLGVGNNGGGGDGGGGGEDFANGGGGNDLNLLTAGAAGFGAGMLGAELSSGRRRRDDRDL